MFVEIEVSSANWERWLPFLTFHHGLNWDLEGFPRWYAGKNKGGATVVVITELSALEKFHVEWREAGQNRFELFAFADLPAAVNFIRGLPSMEPLGKLIGPAENST